MTHTVHINVNTKLHDIIAFLNIIGSRLTTEKSSQEKMLYLDNILLADFLSQPECTITKQSFFSKFDKIVRSQLCERLLFM